MVKERGYKERIETLLQNCKVFKGFFHRITIPKFNPQLFS